MFGEAHVYYGGCKCKEELENRLWILTAYAIFFHKVGGGGGGGVVSPLVSH